MADVFISYSTADEEFARLVYKTLGEHDLSAFLASVSLKPGDVWGDKIRSELQDSPIVLCLMSKAACASPYVNQEFGMAANEYKTIIPLVWDIDPAELPGWLRKYQAFDLRKSSVAEYAGKLSELASSIRSKRSRQQIVAVVALAALAFILIYNERSG